MRYGKHDYKYRLTQLGTEKIKNDLFYRRGSLKGHKSYTEILCCILFDCPDIGFKEIENKFIASGGGKLEKYKDLSRSLELILLSCIKRKEEPLPENSSRKLCMAKLKTGKLCSMK